VIRVVPGLILISIVIAVWVVFPREVAWRALTVVAVVEMGAAALVHTLRRSFPWLITRADRIPQLDSVGLKRYFQHGFDAELGWVRKPNTSKEEIGKGGRPSTFHIDKNGSRRNPGHEHWPVEISCYGDSFPFGRQVNDDETFEWFLSEKTHANVLNFAVGNYGLDQALLRLKREFPRHPTGIVIMAVVPSTIVRILSVWKHYNEFGNTFGFKPRYVMEDGGLQLVPNFVDSPESFADYPKQLPEIQKVDGFYKSKFLKDMLCFPYSIKLLMNPLRNIPLLMLVIRDQLFSRRQDNQPYPGAMRVIMNENFKLRRRLFREKDGEGVDLLERLVQEFVAYGAQQGFLPVFMWMPQKDDVGYVKRHGSYYAGALERIRRHVCTVDLTDDLAQRSDLDTLYVDDNQYGGHLSREGNELVSDVLFRELRPHFEERIMSKQENNNE
jgi:hypothetical protein